MTSPRDELEAAIEAILFVATEPVAHEKLYALFVDDEREAVDAAFAAVVQRYQGGPAQGLVADFAGGGVRLVTRPALQGWLRKFFQVSGRAKLSMAALETLAIVAYRQPITAPEIQELRGVSSTGVLKTLLDHRLVRIAGRKEVVGKPFLYCTSREFLIRFGLNRLQDLPPLEELEQILAAQTDTSSGSPAEQVSLFPNEEVEAALAEEWDESRAVDEATPALPASAWTSGQDAPGAENASSSERALEDDRPIVETGGSSLEESWAHAGGDGPGGDPTEEP